MKLAPYLRFGIILHLMQSSEEKLSYYDEKIIHLHYITPVFLFLTVTYWRKMGRFVAYTIFSNYWT